MADSGMPATPEPKDSEAITDAMESMLFPGEVETPEADEPQTDEDVTPQDAADEATDDATSESSGDADPIEEFKHLDKTYRVNKSLKDAFTTIRAEATRTAMEAAEMRKMVQVEKQNIEAEAQFRTHAMAEFDALQQVEAQLARYRSVDLRSLTTDERVTMSLDLDLLRTQRDEAQQRLRVKQQEYMQLREQSDDRMRNAAKEYLSKALPGGFTHEADVMLAQQAMAEGFTPEEARTILDPRMLKMMWKAAQWDRVQSSKQSVLKRAQEAPPVTRQGAVDPGTSRKMQDLNFRKQLKQEKSPYGKERLIQNKLERMFG